MTANDIQPAIKPNIPLIVVSVFIFGFYAWLWIDYLYLYNGKAGWRGFNLFMYTCFTAPFYAAFVLYCLYVAIITRNKNLLIIITGSALILSAHLIAVFN